MIILAQERERAPTLDRLGFQNRVGLIGFELLLGDAGSHASAVSGQGCGSGWGGVHHKDAPILAAAIGSGAQYLVTWNTRHFFRDPGLARDAGIVILTPLVLYADISSIQDRGQRA